MNNTVAALDPLRQTMRNHIHKDEATVVSALIETADLSGDDRAAISKHAADLVGHVRQSAAPTLMESFLGEYGLSTSEGIALMCLAEALLRVPDAETIDDLIADKITSSDWAQHSGQSSSTLVNASTWALMLTGRVLTETEDRSVSGTLRALVRRMGEPVVRRAVAQAMKELGRQFVLGQTIAEATKEARRAEEKGYTYSYDMLGEGACTDADARRYHLAYADAITTLAKRATAGVRDNPGISVKLSALHPRYEATQKPRTFDTLVARTRSLAMLARENDLGFNIDAEEADRLDMSLDVIEAVLFDPALAGWDGFGVVVQAYGRRAAPVLDWLYALAGRLDRRIMVRLVKGAYWDTEIKQAQVMGLADYPVFTRKASTDVSYIACARKLLSMTDRIYPQFATHNAHTVSAILHMASDPKGYEFQRLHGMGEALYDSVMQTQDARCRIYAPVGAHSDLLAYLVRRLLENGANSSFVHQIVDEDVPADAIAADPFDEVDALGFVSNPAIPQPSEIFAPRVNSKGWDVNDPQDLAAIDKARDPFRAHVWSAAPVLSGEAAPNAPRDCVNPTNLGTIGQVSTASSEDVDMALSAAQPWAEDQSKRASVLERAADLYETHFGEIFALLAREAGKTLPDCIAELREAVDFLRYYARQSATVSGQPRGVFTCISPWNFPLAIFTGQIAAALATGNAVLAKPAEQTPLISHLAVGLLHKAGVPRSALQLLPGDGAVGAALTSDPRVDGICFTGSTETAGLIQKSMAQTLSPRAPLIAETGGLNAMIVDSTALPEQVVRDVIASAFQSAGQRCSALRMLYLQSDITDDLTEMLKGAMDALTVGDPWNVVTDVGPIIDADARDGIANYLSDHPPAHQIPAPDAGYFIAPALIALPGIAALEREVFGPVLHVAKFEASEIDQVIDDINARGYGLTFGLHTRLDDRADHVTRQIAAGNAYVNRNQIGAVVGSQPFGGEGLSGTGPKAGGPHYLHQFVTQGTGASAKIAGKPADLQTAVATKRRPIERSRLATSAPEHPAYKAAIALEPVTALPGPTGERNTLRLFPRGTALCLGPTKEAAMAQVLQSLATGGTAIVPDAFADGLAELSQAVTLISGLPAPEQITQIEDIALVAYAADDETARALRLALAARAGPVVPLITDIIAPYAYVLERHTCTDTTAAGGNAALLAGA